jgi:hypothetical protein
MAMKLIQKKFLAQQYIRNHKENLTTMSQIIECPKCQWQPDGQIYWRCSCDHQWNTFLTKAKCPACGKQWPETYCPGCGKMSPHGKWYHDSSTEPDYPEEFAHLRIKKQKLESRLIALGITTSRVSYLPYLDHKKETFRSPFEAGCRMIILATLAYIAFNPDERFNIINWLRRETLWEHVSPKEKAFLLDLKPEEQTNIEMSWKFESSFALAWCLKITDSLHATNAQAADDEVNNFLDSIPAVGDSSGEFLEKLELRSFEEIYEENLLNEMVTAWLRDAMIMGRQNTTEIDANISFERHHVLNWLRSDFDWDEVDTST